MLSLIFRFCRKVQRALLVRGWKLYGPVYLKLHGVNYADKVMLYGMPLISMQPNSEIILHERVVLCSDGRFTDLGVARPVILKTLRPQAQIVIGKDSGLSGVVVCAAVSVRIGVNCLLGADVQIFDTDFHKLAAENRRHDDTPANIACAAVNIADNVFIGAGSKVLKGVSIGENSVIGAGSVVTKDIPANCIAAGNPAKVIANL